MQKENNSGLHIKTEKKNDIVRLLQDELEATNREVMALTLELDKRIGQRTSELQAAQEELEKTNSELLHLTLELEDRVNTRTQELAEANKALQKEIAERIKTERELEDKNNELEQIVFVTSHDLRSPLVNIQGYSKELDYSVQEIIADISLKGIALDDKLKTIVDEEIPESVKFIENSITKMDSLLNGLLKLSRSGRIPVKPEKIIMDDLIHKVISDFEFLIKTEEVQLIISRLPPCMGDIFLVNQVFSNLLDNALKYLDFSRKGIIKITGAINNRHSVYCIEDNGIGIMEEHIDKIFNIFYRLSPKKTNGEGLGLNIVQKILRRLDGKIHVKSEYGKGSKFFVYLPAV